MKNFSKTAETVYSGLNELTKQYTNVFNEFDSIWYSSSNNVGWSTKQISEHVYLVNQHVISKIKFLKNLLLEGLINNEIEYFESDLRIVDTMLSVSIYKLEASQEFTHSLCFSSEEMKLKLLNQVKILKNLVQELPLEMISNYKESPKLMSGIKLDTFQLVYLAIKHSQHHFAQISTLKTIDSALYQEALVAY